MSLLFSGGGRGSAGFLGAEHSYNLRISELGKIEGNEEDRFGNMIDITAIYDLGTMDRESCSICKTVYALQMSHTTKK